MKVTERDKLFFNGVSKTGIWTKEQALEFGVTKQRLQMYEKNNFIKNEGSNKEDVITLTKKAERYTDRDIYSKASLKHDTALTAEYLKAVKQYGASNVKAHTGKAHAKAHGVEVSGAPDMVLEIETEEGIIEEIGIEIVTNNYSEADKEEKVTYAKSTNLKLKMVQAETMKEIEVDKEEDEE